jgi:uncharacterized protein
MQPDIFERHSLIQLEEDLRDYPAVAITGARQVGKTTLVRQVEQLVEMPVQYLDLELPEDAAKLQNPVLFFKTFEQSCIILDEIHRMPELFPILRAVIDQIRKPGRFIILGSASPALLRDSSESLAGRISYIRMHPLSLSEVKKEVAWQTLFMRGGFPNALLASSDRSSERWRGNFIRTYLERELPILGLDSDVRILRKLLIMLAHSQSGTLNTQTLANSLGVSRPTVVRYIDFMEKAYLLTRMEPFFVNISKRLVKSPKVYISDSGLFHSLLGIQTFEDLLSHPSAGASWEGFVIQQTRCLMPPEHDLWFFRTHEGAEADIVLTRSDVPIAAAEIKLSNAPKVSKGLRNVVSYLETKHNYIITPSADLYPVADNIQVTGLQGWLDFLGSLR